MITSQIERRTKRDCRSLLRLCAISALSRSRCLPFLSFSLSLSHFLSLCFFLPPPPLPIAPGGRASFREVGTQLCVTSSRLIIRNLEHPSVLTLQDKENPNIFHRKLKSFCESQFPQNSSTYSLY